MHTIEFAVQDILLSCSAIVPLDFIQTRWLSVDLSLRSVVFIS